MNATLAREGFTVVNAADGSEGLRLARAAPPDLVITDINMPVMNGFEMAQAIADLPGGESIPVLFMSTMDDRANFRSAMQAGARDYLVKPFKPEELLDAVRRVLARPPSLAKTRSMSTPWALDLPGYEWQRLLGTGSSAHVYLGTHLASGASHAVKLVTLPADSAAAQEMIGRFLNEISLLASIVDPHVARIYDHGVTDDYLYYAMEYFPGGDLRTRMADKVPPREAARFAIEALRALAAIHAKAIVHRDMKPDNLMLRADGSLALADFGIAKPVDGALKLTQENMTQGTPYYVSPEQLRGRPATARSDLYSMGVVIHELLTGAPPYGGQRMDIVLAQHLTAPIPKLRHELAAFQPLIDGLLVKSPADRIATAQDALNRLEQIIAQLPD
jgi:serine/threonine protein kinase